MFLSKLRQAGFRMVSQSRSGQLPVVRTGYFQQRFGHYLLPLKKPGTKIFGGMVQPFTSKRVRQLLLKGKLLSPEDRPIVYLCCGAINSLTFGLET